MRTGPLTEQIGSHYVLCRTVRALPGLWCVLACLAGGVASAAARPTVTVLYFEVHAESDSLAPLGKGLADMITTDLSALPGVQLVERQRLEAVLQELALQQSVYFDPATAQRIGKQLGAEFA